MPRSNIPPFIFAFLLPAVSVYNWDDDWMEGENQDGKAETFPNTYVKEIKGGPKVVSGMPA